MKNNHIVQIIGFLALSMLFACGQNVINEERTEKNKKIQQATEVEAIVIEPAPFPLQSIANGKIHSAAKADLYFNTEGIINEVNYKNGDVVSKGQLIASLKCDMAKIELARAEETVMSAENELSYLLLGFGGKEGDTNSVNNQLLQKLKSQSGYTMAFLSLKAARLNYENNFIYSPFNAIVEGLEHQKYNKISPSDKFCTLLSNKGFIVEFKLIENELQKIKPGRQIDVYKLNNDSIKYNAVISELNPLVDKNGLLTIKAKLLSSSNTHFVEGMNVKIIINNYLKPCLSVPKNAVVLRSGKEVVFTFNNGLAKWNYVKTMAENTGYYAISDGLSPGDTVIVSGALNLAHDAAVKLKSVK